MTWGVGRSTPPSSLLPTGSNGTLETVTSPTTLVWAPSGLVRDLAGQSCGSGTVTENGAADVDF